MVGKDTFLTTDTTSLNKTSTRRAGWGSFWAGGLSGPCGLTSLLQVGTSPCFGAQRLFPYLKSLCYIPGPPPGQGGSGPIFPIYF